MHHSYQWCLGLSLILLQSVLSWDAAADEPEVDRYQSILRRTANRGDKLQIFQSIWGAIRADFPNDTDKAKGLYTQLGNFILNEIHCSSGSTGQIACEMQQEVRRHLRNLMAQRMSNLLNAEESIATYGMYIAASVEPQLVRDILNRMIEDIYFHRPLEQLILQLEELYINGDEISYRMMIEAQMALYWRYHQLGDANELYEFNLGHILSKIESNHLFQNTDASLQRRVQTVHSNLPTVLSRFFDTEGFCLINRMYDGYIYTTVTDDFNYGLNGRQVFLWHEKNYTDSAGRMRVFANDQTIRESGQYAKPNFSLRGELYKWYLFVDPSQGNRLAALRTGTPSPSSSYWNIHWNRIALIFRQGNLVLCADELHDKERRFIKMLPYNLEEHNESCRWKPVVCAPTTA